MRSLLILFLVIAVLTCGSQFFIEESSSLHLSSIQDTMENGNQIVLTEKNDAFTEEISISDDFLLGANNTIKFSPAANLISKKSLFVAWGEYIDDNVEIHGQILDLGGQDLYSEIYISEGMLINTTTELEITISRINSEYFAVVWSAYEKDSDMGRDIFLRIFYMNSTAYTDIIDVAVENNDQINPLAIYNNDELSVIWTDIDGIYIKTYTYNGSMILDKKLYDIIDPSFVNIVTIKSSSQYVISWKESNILNLQYITFNGTILGDSIPLLDDDTLTSFDITSNLHDNNDLMFTWSNGSSNIYFQRFSLADETLIGDIKRINTYTGVNKKANIIPLAGDALFLITWIGEEQDGLNEGIFGYFYDLDYVPYNEEFLINDFLGNKTQYDIIRITGLKLFAVWRSEYETYSNIYGRIIKADLELIKPAWIRVRATIFLLAFMFLLFMTFIQFFRLTCCVSKNLEAKWHLTIQHFFLIIVITIQTSLCGRTLLQGPLNETNLYGTFVLSLDSIAYALIFGVFSVTILVLANVFHIAVERGQVAHVKSIRGPFQAIMGLVALFIIGYHGILSSFEDDGRKVVLNVFTWILLLITFILAIVMFVYCHLLAKALRAQIEPDLQPGKKGGQVIKKKKVKGTVLILGPIFSTLLFMGVIARRFGVDNPHFYETYRNIYVVLDFFTLGFLLLFLDRTMYQAIISHSKTRPYTKCAVWCIKHDLCTFCYPATQVAITPYVPRTEVTSPTKIREYTPSKKREDTTPSKKREVSTPSKKKEVSTPSKISTPSKRRKSISKKARLRTKSPSTSKKREASPTRMIAEKEEEMARTKQHLMHIDTITCLALSLNEKRIYSGSNDNRLLTWDAKTGSLLQVNSGHIGKITSILPFRTSQKVEMVATASEDHSVIIWDPLSRKKMKYYNIPYHKGTVTDLCFNNNILYSSSTDKTIIGYEAKTKDGYADIKLHRFVGSSSPINQVIVVPNENFVYGACVDSRIRVWDMKNPEKRGKELVYEIKYILDSHVGPIKKMKFIEEKNEIITVDSSGAAIIWRAPLISPQRMPYYFTEHPNADIKASLGVKKTKRFLVHKDAITELCLAPGGRIGYTSSRDGTASIWDIREMERKYCVYSDEFTSEVEAQFVSNLNPLSRISTCAGNLDYLCTAGNEGRLRCYDVKTGKLLWYMDSPTSSINTMVMNNTSVFTAGPDAMIRRWSLKDGTLQTVYASKIDKFRYLTWANLMGIFGIIGLFIGFFQLSGLTYFINNDYYELSDPFKVIISTTLLDYNYIRYHITHQEMDAITTIFYFVSIIIILLNVIFYFFAYKLQNSTSGWKLILWNFTKILFSYSASVMYLPLVHNCFIGSFSTTQILISFLILIVFFPIAYRVCRANYDVGRIAFNHYFRFNYDDPDMSKFNKSSRKSREHNTLMFYIKTFAVILNVIIPEITLFSVIMLITFTFNTIYIFLRPQYYDDGINCLNMALMSALCFTGLFAVQMSFVGEYQEIYPLIHHVGLIITFLLAYYIMTIRVANLNKEIEIKKLRSQKIGVSSIQEQQRTKVEQRHEQKLLFCSVCGVKYHENWQSIHEASPIHIRNYKRTQPDKSSRGSKKREGSRSKSRSKSKKT